MVSRWIAFKEQGTCKFDFPEPRNEVIYSIIIIVFQIVALGIAQLQIFPGDLTQRTRHVAGNAWKKLISL